MLNGDEIKSSVAKFYDDVFYGVNYTDEKVIKRDIDAKYKAENILSLLSTLTPHNTDFKGYKILDCGCGVGNVISFVERSEMCKEIYGVDISESAIRFALERHYEKLTEIKLFDGYRMDYPDNYFDIAYCTHVIEHVEHPRMFIRELKRISKYQIFEVPLDYYSFLLETQTDKQLGLGHLNIYSRLLFRYFLKSEGFIIEKEKCSAHRISWYREIERVTKAKLAKRIKNRILLIIRGVLNMPLIRYLNDGLGYSHYTVLTRYGGL